VVLGSDVADGSVNFAPTTDPLNGDKELPELTFGEAAINLTDSGLLKDLCAGFGAATLRSRASAAFNAELKDFIAPIKISITRPGDPTTAHARGESTGAMVDNKTVLGENNPKFLPEDPGTPIRTEQNGPGTAGPVSAQQDNPRVPEDGSVFRADVVRATSTSSVAASGATETNTAEALNVNIMNGLVTAEHVVGVAQTVANKESSSFSTTGSKIEGVVVNGEARNNVSPNTRIGLPAAVYGEGSFVGLFELGPGTNPDTGTTSQPATLGQPGTYAADLVVTMIRVHITDDNGALPGGNPAEIIVSKAVAHSDFQGIRCADSEVSGHALIASALTTPPVAPARVGYVAIPRSGGAQSQHLDSTSLGGDTGTLLTTGAADSSSTGAATDSSSEADSFAEVNDVCALPTPTGDCTVSAQVLRAASHSIADADGRSSDDADTTVVATVQGKPVVAQQPNTREELEDPSGNVFGFVTFNEQTCDLGASLENDCATDKGTGLTVRGIHIVLTVGDNPLGLKAGTEVIVSEAHSDATFVPQ
jgi:hypothetical protein